MRLASLGSVRSRSASRRRVRADARSASTHDRTSRRLRPLAPPAPAAILRTGMTGPGRVARPSPELEERSQLLLGEVRMRHDAQTAGARLVVVELGIPVVGGDELDELVGVGAALGGIGGRPAAHPQGAGDVTELGGVLVADREQVAEVPEPGEAGARPVRIGATDLLLRATEPPVSGATTQVEEVLRPRPDARR